MGKLGEGEKTRQHCLWTIYFGPDPMLAPRHTENMVPDAQNSWSRLNADNPALTKVHFDEGEEQGAPGTWRLILAPPAPAM